MSIVLYCGFRKIVDVIYDETSWIFDQGYPREFRRANDLQLMLEESEAMTQNLERSIDRVAS